MKNQMVSCSHPGFYIFPGVLFNFMFYSKKRPSTFVSPKMNGLLFSIISDFSAMKPRIHNDR